MKWLDRQIDKLLDAWEMKDVEELEIYGDEDNGYILEYGDRVREFESSGELITYYNERLKDLMDREPPSVVGQIDEIDEKRLDKSEGYAAVRDEEWAVDVYDTAAEYVDRAVMKAFNDATISAEINLSNTEEEIEEKLVDEIQNMKSIDAEERAENYIINAISGTITQAVVESEIASEMETDREYIIKEIDKLEK